MEYNDKITWFPPLAPYSPKMDEVIQCTIDTITFRGTFTILPQFLPFYTLFIKNGKWYNVKITECAQDSTPDILTIQYSIQNELGRAKNPDVEMDHTGYFLGIRQQDCMAIYKQSQLIRRERGENVEVPEDSDNKNETGSDHSLHYGCEYDADPNDPYCGFLPPGVTYDETDEKYYYDDASSEESFHCGCCYDPYPDDPYGGNTPPGFDYEEEANLRKVEGQDHHTKKQIYKRGKPSIQAREARAEIIHHKQRVLRNQIVSEKKSGL